MPTNVNALFIAWAASLILVVGGVLLMEATYDPEAARLAAEAAAKMHQQENASPEIETTEEEDPDAPDTVIDLADQENIIPVQALPDLLESDGDGALPRIAEDGRVSYNVYAAAKPRDRTTPRIAIMITDLGLKTKQTRKVITELSSEISLAFSPYSNGLHAWGEQARSDGHEVFLSIPMEPQNYPQNDPGSLALLTSFTTRANLGQLRKSMRLMAGYVGVVSEMGSRFTAASDSMRPVLDELKVRGLMFVDSRTTPYSRAATMAKAVGVPVALNNGFIDDNLAQELIAEELLKLETRAKTQGAAMGIGRPYPVTVEALRKWSEGLAERGFLLVPVTSIANLQALPR